MTKIAWVETNLWEFKALDGLPSELIDKINWAYGVYDGMTPEDLTAMQIIPPITCGVDFASGLDKIVAWLGKYGDGGITFTPITEAEFYADPVRNKTPDWIVIDDIPPVPRVTHKPVKPWVQMNSKPSWLGRRK